MARASVVKLFAAVEGVTAQVLGQLHQLDVEVEAAVERTSARVQDVEVTTTRDLAAVASRVTEDAERVFGDVGAAVSRAAEGAVVSARGASEQIEEASRSVVASAQAAEAQGREALDRLSALASETKDKVGSFSGETTSELDKFLAHITKFSNEHSAIITQALNLVKTGELEFESFIHKFGDYEVALDTGVKSIRELLAGIDLGEIDKKNQELRKLLLQNKLDIEDIMTELGEIQITSAKQLLEVLRLYQQGKATIEDVLKLVKFAQDTLPDGSTTKLLADEIEESLRTRSKHGGF